MQKYFILLLAVCFSSSGLVLAQTEHKVVSVDRFEQHIHEKDVQLIDVRTEKEFDSLHIPGFKNLNVLNEDFSEKIKKLDKNKPVLVYCKSGRRSARAADEFIKAGFKNVYELEGGITAWIDRKKPVKESDLRVIQYTKTVDQYIYGLTNQAFDKVIALFADSATIEDPVGSKILKGKDAVHEFYKRATQLKLSLVRTGAVRIAGNEAAFPFQLRMQMNGKQTITDIIDVFKFNDEGKIISMRAYWGESNRSEAKE